MYHTDKGLLLKLSGPKVQIPLNSLRTFLFYRYIFKVFILNYINILGGKKINKDCKYKLIEVLS